MGYSKADIERTMPDIEAFAQVGEYFDQPTRLIPVVCKCVWPAFKPDLLIKVNVALIFRL